MVTRESQNSQSAHEIYNTGFYVHRHIKICANGRPWVNYADFITELNRASLSIRAFAGLVGMRPNSISNYASAGEVPRHLGLIAALLGELKDNGVSFDTAISRAGPVAKRPRVAARPRRFGGDPQAQLDLGA